MVTSTINMIKIYLIKLICGLIPAFLPPIHIFILYKYWGKYSRRVDKRYCSCSCWDTVFKGAYESGIASYKHMYFNATINSTKIWLFTVGYIILLYECLRFEIKLLVFSQLRFLMAILFLSSLFSHYYTWWVYINYWNDEFYLQWNHQLFFSITEVISTLLVLNISNSKIPVTSKKVLSIISIAFIHIFCGGLDQFVTNVFLGEGHTYQVLRDLGFMLPDLLHVILPLIEFLKYQKQNEHVSICHSKKDLIVMIMLTLFGILISTFL